MRTMVLVGALVLLGAGGAAAAPADEGAGAGRRVSTGTDGSAAGCGDPVHTARPGPCENDPGPGRTGTAGQPDVTTPVQVCGETVVIAGEVVAGDPAGCDEDSDALLVSVPMRPTRAPAPEPAPHAGSTRLDVAHPSATAPATAPATIPAAAPATLADTGFSADRLVPTGLLMIVAGAAITRAGRRRPARRLTRLGA